MFLDVRVCIYLRGYTCGCVCLCVYVGTFVYVCTRMRVNRLCVTLFKE